MDKYFNGKELIKGILVILLYFILPSILTIPFLFVTPNGNETTIYNFELYYVYLSLSFIFMLFYFKDIKKEWKDFKKNDKKHLKIAFSYWIKGLFVMFVFSFFINTIDLPSNVNQESNIEILKALPFTEFFLACITAPFIEEIVFRKSLFKAIKNDKVYILVTSFLFAFIHITTSLSNPVSLLYLIPYGALGVAFAFTLKKTNNIFSTIVIHSTHNFLALLLLVLGGL